MRPSIVRHGLLRAALLTLAFAATAAGSSGAQTTQLADSTAPGPDGAAVPQAYVIGAEDVLGVLVWREPEMSGDVTVRPDGIITLPLIGEVVAAGLQPGTLRDHIQSAASRYLTDAKVMVVVRQINSRKAFITGEVATPGAYPLAGPRTVMQLIALAGGLTEFADSNNITIMRTENGRQLSFKFHYKDVARGKSLAENLLLQPGDTVVVP
jgi:polysaccharide export outer membrane protein